MSETTKQRRIRSSSLPMAFLCPGSILRTEVRIDPVSLAADQGTAGHVVMRQIVETDAKSIDGIDIAAIARRYEADPDELQIQAFTGVAVWKQIRDWFGNAQAEVELSVEIAPDIFVTGHLDAFVLDRGKRTAYLADWKFGRVDGNYTHQLMCYAALVLLTYPEIESVRMWAVWMREQEIEPYSLDRDGLDEWLGRLHEEVIGWDGTYHPGPQCAHCEASHGCPAITAMVRRDVEMLSGPEMAARIETGLADLPAAEVVGLRRRAKVIERILDSLDTAIKHRVEAAGGALSDGEGRELRFMDSKRRKIDPMLAWPVLQARLTDEEIASATKLSASKIDAAVSDKTERGKKKQAIEALGAELAAAGAVGEEVVRRLEDRKERAGS